MAVSKRLRYEVLRRDNHTCRYCGESAPEVKLTIDHVVPVALGGKDEPKNLVAACEPCNSGKSSSSPDSTLIDDVSEDAIRWAKAMRRASDMMRKDRESQREFCMQFIRAMEEIEKMDPVAVAPSMDSAGGIYAAFHTLNDFHSAGLSLGDLVDAMSVAMTNRRIHEDSIWRYFCGICWRKIDDLHEIARSLIETGDV